MMKFFLISLLFPLCSLAGPTKVGNGDDGADLENLVKIESGILIETRNKALDQLNHMNVRGISGLGSLPDELKNADIFIVQNNISNPKEFDAGMESSPDGKVVYARTFARPYSPVRFFPASLALSEEQLIRLHIHEALHRALPESIRENESIVSEITLALTSPTASRDTIASIVQRYTQIDTSPLINRVSMDQPKLAPSKKLLDPSLLRVRYESFNLTADEQEIYPIKGLLRVDSFVYPFGGSTNSLGVGISMSLLDYADKKEMGPLQISARQILNTWRGFDVEAFIDYSMFSLSDDTLKNSSQARDVGTLGLLIRKESDRYFTENSLRVSGSSEKEFTLANVVYVQEYSPIVTAKIGAGYKKDGYFLGGNLQFSLSDGSRIKSSSQSFETQKERMNLATAGLEGGVSLGNLQWTLYGQTVLSNKSRDSLTNLGQLLEQGAGQGHVGTSISFNY